MMEAPQMIVALSLTSFCCLIGIPVWWQTTRVYRAPLPYNEITSMAEMKNHFQRFQSQWSVFIDGALLQGDSTRFISFQNSFKSLLKENFPLVDIKVAFKQFLFDASTVNVSAPNADNIQVFIDDIHASIEDQIKLIVEKHEDVLHQNIIFVKMSIQLSESLGTSHALLFGTSHVIVLLESLQPDQLKQDMEWALSKMQGILFPPLDEYTDIDSGKYHTEGSSLQSSSGLDISFTLANANSLDSIVDWNIEHAICTELMPFLHRISDFGPFSITSQILNSFHIGLEPKKVKNGGGYFHSLKKLPLLINPLEVHLNEYTSNKPILKFVLYIPQITHTPLMFRHEGVSYQSFTSPRWGSVIIKNLNHANMLSNITHGGQEFKSRKIEVESDIQVIVSHFRELIGLKRKAAEEMFFASLGKSAIASWEINYLLLKGTIENLRKAVSNLVSLAELLGKIANIVIRDDIRIHLEQATENIKKSRSLLTHGQIRESFLASKSAVLISEKAFYDHSLLALLYFPNDQKYAIYLPLFFPIFMPLVAALFYALRTIFSNYRAKKLVNS